MKRALLSLAAAGAVLALSSAALAANPVHAVGNHKLLAPECSPVKSARWFYPGPQKISSNLYELFATNYSCSEAAKWTARMVRAQIPVKNNGNTSKIRGPAGFVCGAWPDAHGRAYAGGCKKGNSEFGWNWNVADRRVVPTPDENGAVHLIQLIGTDANSVLRNVGNNRYELDVQNTSGVGFLTGFTWAPPPGWTITSVGKSSLGTCKLKNTKIVCTGDLRPPTCLCRGDGETLTIEFTVAVTPAPATKGHPTTYGSAGAQVRITSMKPVPYLIPGTPARAAKQSGV